MLGEHNITYWPRTSMKGQILADFHVEKPNEALPDTPVVETPQESWTLFTDGSLCVDGSGAGLILTSPEGMEFTYALRFQFTASNNEVEYEALIASLRIITHMGVRNVHVGVDSKLVAKEVPGTYVLVKVLKEKSIQEKEVATMVEEDGPTWMPPIMEYLKDGTLPEDGKEASKLHIKARQYELLEGVLYRRSCNMYARPRSVMAKAIRLGYYWPTMHRDARDMIRKSGPFPEGPGKVKFLIVAMDYFTKWIEAKAMAMITGSQVKKFVWDNIVCRFGLSREIVSDKGKQFNDNLFKDWCEKLNITQRFASVKHPQSIRVVESTNMSLAIHEAKAKSKMTMYYNARVRGVTFGPGDFVYHSNEASHAMDGRKLGLKWERPYEVTKALKKEAYRLRSMDRTVLPRMWNIVNLKKCYL
nr:hypothetical protein [Tanacetum cinerariifolium]